MKYHNTIKEVIDEQDMRIGFIARFSTIYGCSQHQPNGWVASESVIKPFWFGNFAKRSHAVKELKKTRPQRQRDEIIKSIQQCKRNLCKYAKNKEIVFYYFENDTLSDLKTRLYQINMLLGIPTFSEAEQLYYYINNQPENK